MWISDETAEMIVLAFNYAALSAMECDGVVHVLVRGTADPSSALEQSREAIEHLKRANAVWSQALAATGVNISHHDRLDVQEMSLEEMKSELNQLYEKVGTSLVVDDLIAESQGLSLEGDE